MRKPLQEWGDVEKAEPVIANQQSLTSEAAEIKEREEEADEKLKERLR